MNRDKKESRKTVNCGKNSSQRIYGDRNNDNNGGKHNSIALIRGRDGKVSRTEAQMEQMRQLLLFNLELIQQQKDWLTRKDEQIAQLKDQNEKVNMTIMLYILDFATINYIMYFHHKQKLPIDYFHCT